VWTPLLLAPPPGGSSLIKAGQALKGHGPFLLVATPGRLAKLLRTGMERKVLSKPRFRPARITPQQLLSGQLVQPVVGRPDLSVTLVLEEVRGVAVCGLD
jgi:hypothetical protein